MAMTNDNMAPPVIPNLKLADAETIAQKLAEAKQRNEDTLKAAAKIVSDKLAAEKQSQDINTKANDPDNTADSVDDVYSATSQQFKDEVAAELRAQLLQLEAERKAQGTSVAIADLTEDDAYNLDVSIQTVQSVSPDFLKIVLHDKNYIARWCNTNPLRQGYLIGQGFKRITPDEVANLDTLKMFLDAKGNFVYVDLIAMKIPKNIYYAGIRQAYVRSLRASSNKKAAEAGAVFAANNLRQSLSGNERAYLATHEDVANKPVYNPTVGV